MCEGQCHGLNASDCFQTWDSVRSLCATATAVVTSVREDPHLGGGGHVWHSENPRLGFLMPIAKRLSSGM